MIRARPILVTENSDTWREDFVQLWSLEDWVHVPRADLMAYGLDSAFNNKTPLVISPGPEQLVEMRWYAFVYPGPCGRTTHWVLAGRSHRIEENQPADQVLWHAYRGIHTRWTPEDLENISYFQAPDTRREGEKD